MTPPLHDHPWGFLSIIVAGAYDEITPTGRVRRRRGSVAVRRATHRHSVVLPRAVDGAEVPCVTVIITGPHVRQWGFWCSPTRFGDVREHFIPWWQFGSNGCDTPRSATPLTRKEIQR